MRVWGKWLRSRGVVGSERRKRENDGRHPDGHSADIHGASTMFPRCLEEVMFQIGNGGPQGKGLDWR